MRLAYDAQADVLSLVFREGAVERSALAHGVIVNLDALGAPVAIDVLHARRWIGPLELSRIAIDLHDLWMERGE